MQDKVNKYEEISEITRDKALEEINSGISEKIVMALLSLAYYDSDWHWVQELCVKYANNPDENVRGIALLCFGHLSRIHKKIDRDIVIPILQDARKDHSYFVRGHAEDALSDIMWFTKE